MARLLKFIAISIAAVVGMLAIAAISSGHSAWASAGLIAVLFVYAAALAAEFSWVYRSFNAADRLRPTAAQIVRAWWREATSTPVIFLWRQAFRSHAVTDSLVASLNGGHCRGVILIHGYFCNRGIWNPWMLRLRAEGIPFSAVDLHPPFGSIDDYSTIVEEAVAAMDHATGKPPVIVAHSMGGLAARAWATRSGGASRCHSIVTIGSPHRGTGLARHATTSNGREMRIGSDWLARLEAHEKQSARARFVCFWGHCDNIVFPSANATLPEADNRHLEATPHVQMIFHPAVFDAVRGLVDEPSAEPVAT